MNILVLERCDCVKGKIFPIESIRDVIADPIYSGGAQGIRDLYKKYLELSQTDPVKAETYHKQYRDKKKTLLFTCFGLAPESGNRNDKELSGLLYMDFDYKENKSFTVQQIKEILVKEFPNLTLAFASCSGLGVGCVLWYGKALTPDTYKKIYVANAQRLEMKYGLIADAQCAHCERGTFVSNDIDCIFNSFPECVDISNVVKDANLLLLGKEDENENYQVDSEAGLEKDILDTINYCIEKDVLLIDTYYEWLVVLSVICKSFRDDPEKAFLLGHKISAINKAKYNRKDTDKKIAELLKRPLDRITEKTFYWYAKRAGYQIYSPKKRITSYQEFEAIVSKTDTELVLYLCDELFSDNIKFNVSSKKFMFYKDGIWETSEKFKVNERLDKWVRELTQQVRNDLYEEERSLPASVRKQREKEFEGMHKTVQKFRERFMRTGANIALSNHFQNIESILTSNYEIDTHNDKICLNNGVFCFKNFELIPHRKEFMFSKKLNINYNPYADCPNFLKFLKEVFENKEEYIDFFQKFIGLCLTGYTDKFQGVVFLYGTGSNGKSVFIRILEEFLAGYYTHIGSDIIVDRKGAFYNEEYLKATLFGARIAIISEIPANGRIKDNVLKDLTGGDTVQARHPHERVFHFKPTHKLLMYGNHKPYIPNTDEGVWRRMFLVNFGKVFKPEERRPSEDIIGEIRQEFPGIFNWAVLGYKNLCEERKPIQMTKQMMLDALEYRNSQNPLYEFLVTNFKEAEGARIERDEVYEMYRNYCDENNIQYRNIFSKEKFSRAINNSYMGASKLIIKRVGKSQTKYIYNLAKLEQEEKEDYVLNENNDIPF